MSDKVLEEKKDLEYYESPLVLRLYSKFQENPSGFLQIVTTILFAITVIILLISVFLVNDSSYKNILLILGVLSIVLIMLNASQRGFPASFAVILIGTVVAQADFILAAAGVLRSDSQDIPKIIQS